MRILARRRTGALVMETVSCLDSERLRMLAQSLSEIHRSFHS